MTRNEAIALLEGVNAEEAKNYIEEAEHQDGTEYWDGFPNAETLLEDFKLWCEGVAMLKEAGL